MKIISAFLLILIISSGYAQTDQLFNKPDTYMEQANIISVTIGGNAVVNGTFHSTMTERVDQFITRIFNEASLQEKTPIKLNPQVYSFRDVTLKHADGTQQKIDLAKFHLNGDFVNNPYLKNDDVIIFPQVDLLRNFFYISGAVNNTGGSSFYFVEGDKLKDAIEFAGGINKAYVNVTTANIWRLSYDGTQESMISVDINSDFSLQRGDRIIIEANETQKKNYTVRIFGEVNKPGVIPITKDRTTLNDLIKKAGGITPQASLKFARLYSGNSYFALLEGQVGWRTNFNYPYKNLGPTEKGIDPMEEILKIDELNMSRMSSIVPEDTSYFKLENRLRIFTEHSGVDFTKLDDPNSDASNYILKDNDFIIIPARENSVYVFGQVPAQGHIKYVDGRDYRYYIQKAGGYGEYAEKGDVMLIKGNTNQWISVEKNPVVEEGDYIYIPRSSARSFNSYVSQVGGYLGIVASAATIILLLLQFKK